MSKHIKKESKNILSEITGIPVEAISMPLFQMYSNHELIIEGTKSLDYYNKSTVKIKTKICILIIEGENLNVRCLANNNLSVCGHIKSITFD